MKDFITLFIFRVDFVLNLEDNYACLVFFDLKSSTKQGAVKETIDLLQFIKSTIKKLNKGK